MKDIIKITITNISGSRHFSVKQVFTKVLLYIFLTIISGIIISILVIRFLSSEVEDLSAKKNKLKTEYSSIILQNKDLKTSLDLKNTQMVNIKNRIDSLENTIGIVEEKGDKDEKIIERVNLASITVMQKSLVFKLIPSQSPVVKYKRISDPFGRRFHPILHIWHKHTGIDLAIPMKTKIFATADGVVYFSKSGYNGGYGVNVKIRHAFGFTTLYAHLTKPAVKRGEFVKKGQLIGYSGRSGRATGPHLHYEIRYLNVPINPIYFMKWRMDNFDKIFEKERLIRWQSLLTMIKSVLQVQAPLL